MIRRDVLHMAWEICAARCDFDEDPSPTEVAAMLEGGDCDDPTGRTAILVLVTPGLMGPDEARDRGLDEEIIEAAEMSEAAVLEAASGGRKDEPQ